VLRRVEEAPVENTVKLLLPYVTWLAAEWLHASGVLAVLACGLLMSRHWDAISSAARLQARQLWDWLVFVLEGVSFVLVGLQLRTVVEGIEGRSAADLARAALLLNLVVVAVRLAWVYPAGWLPRRLSARLRERDPFPGWGPTTVVGWAGMRGVVSLALALAVPTEVAGGAPFPERNLVVFLAFSVIVVTLVGQGLTLPLLIRRLGVAAAEDEAADATRARARLTEVALGHLDALDPDADRVPPELLDRLRDRYRARLAHLGQHRDAGPQDGAGAHAEVVRDLLQAQRAELRRLREQGDVTAEVARRLDHDLDVEEARLERERRS
jgi:NhaP-type Na+/H+ or K+/H+ antiporter